MSRPAEEIPADDEATADRRFASAASAAGGTPATMIILAAAFVGLRLALGALMNRDLTSLEDGFFQAGALLFGLWGSYLWGTRSASPPNLKSAFRRNYGFFRQVSGVVQYANLKRLAATDAKPSDGRTIATEALEGVEAQLRNLLIEAQDAMEDWRDLDPSAVAEIESRYEEQK